MGEKGIYKLLYLLHYDFDFYISFLLIFLSMAHVPHMPHMPHAICELGVSRLHVYYPGIRLCLSMRAILSPTVWVTMFLTAL